MAVHRTPVLNTLFFYGFHLARRIAASREPQIHGVLPPASKQGCARPVGVLRRNAVCRANVGIIVSGNIGDIGILLLQRPRTSHPS